MRKIVIFVLALLLVATVWKLCGEVVLRFLWLFDGGLKGGDERR